VSYAVRWRTSAERDFSALPRDAQVRILVRVEALADSPRPAASAALAGPLAGLRRLRVGDYRIAYVVDDAERTVGIVALGHRSKFYEDLNRGGA
jgi:mRNA interferase RelE/StbE